jgi:sialic acid synthase SpsE/quercetin dioxygenase-like cupin family protein
MTDPEARPLFVFEMANNHMGQVEHGKRIVREFANVVRDFAFNFGFKLQYRDLATYIHPAYRERMDHKQVKRFTETVLSPEQYLELKDAIVEAGFLAICTPFDEPSVDRVEAHGFHYLKIPSCSFTDWPLLERIAQSQLPIIASVAGATLNEIDAVVSFFTHRKRPLSLLHCVGEYPTPSERLELNQIDLLKLRYPGIEVGYSTHEAPDNYHAIGLAIAKGATIFEKHVGVPTADFQLNAYSATPEQARRWLEAAQAAYVTCGVAGERRVSPEEAGPLRGFARGVFAREALHPGDRLTPANVLLAYPCEDDQLVAADLSKYTEHRVREEIAAQAPIHHSQVDSQETRQQVYQIVSQVNRMLREGGVILPKQVDLEISHHYGIDQFTQYGSCFVTIVNQDYCKRLIILLPGQDHPEHYHVQRGESFIVVQGEAIVTLGEETRVCSVGDIVQIDPGIPHSFRSVGGAVMEEITTKHQGGDSFYTDPEVLDRERRKTIVTYWMGVEGDAPPYAQD